MICRRTYKRLARGGRVEGPESSVTNDPLSVVRFALVWASAYGFVGPAAIPFRRLTEGYGRFDTNEDSMLTSKTQHLPSASALAGADPMKSRGMRTFVLPGGGVLAGLLLAGVPAVQVLPLLFLWACLPMTLVLMWEWSTAGPTSMRRVRAVPRRGYSSNRPVKCWSASGRVSS